MAEVTRAASKTKYETADFPTQEDFEDLHDSVYFKLDDLNIGLNNHTAAIEYKNGNGVFEPATGRIYQAIDDVPIGIALSNTAYWKPQTTSISVLDVADIDNPTELNSRGLADGNVLVVRQSGAFSLGATWYFHSTTLLAADSPYILNTNDSGSWVAFAGRNKRGGTGVRVVTVADIDDPSTELNALGLTDAAILLAKEGEQSTFYVHVAGAGTENVPYTVDTNDTGLWVATSGFYVKKSTVNTLKVAALLQLPHQIIDDTTVDGWVLGVSGREWPVDAGIMIASGGSKSIELPDGAELGDVRIIQNSGGADITLYKSSDSDGLVYGGTTPASVLVPRMAIAIKSQLPGDPNEYWNIIKSGA